MKDKIHVNNWFHLTTSVLKCNISMIDYNIITLDIYSKKSRWTEPKCMTRSRTIMGRGLRQLMTCRPRRVWQWGGWSPNQSGKPWLLFTTKWPPSKSVCQLSVNISGICLCVSFLSVFQMSVPAAICVTDSAICELTVIQLSGSGSVICHVVRYLVSMFQLSVCLLSVRMSVICQCQLPASVSYLFVCQVSFSVLANCLCVS